MRRGRKKTRNLRSNGALSPDGSTGTAQPPQCIYLYTGEADVNFNSSALSLWMAPRAPDVQAGTVCLIGSPCFSPTCATDLQLPLLLTDEHTFSCLSESLSQKLKLKGKLGMWLGEKVQGLAPNTKHKTDKQNKNMLVAITKPEVSMYNNILLPLWDQKHRFSSNRSIFKVVEFPVCEPRSLEKTPSSWLLYVWV